MLVSSENRDEHLGLAKERGIFPLVKGLQCIKRPLLFQIVGHLFFHWKVHRHFSNNCGILRYFNIIYYQCELLRNDADYSVQSDDSGLVISIPISFCVILFLSCFNSVGFLLLNSEVSAFGSLLFSLVSQSLWVAGKKARWINLILSTTATSTSTYLRQY